jgi:hypothetical protein
LENPVNEMSCGIRYPPPATGGADCTTFAQIGHHAVLSAGIAVHAQEAVRQDAALQKLAELTLDEPLDKALPLALPGQEGLEMLSDCIIENRVRRIARDVIRGGVAHGKTILLTFLLILMKTDSILAWHRQRGLPGFRKPPSI